MRIVSPLRGAAVVTAPVAVTAVVSAGPAAAARSETYCSTQLDNVYCWTNLSLNASNVYVAAAYARFAKWANDLYNEAGC